MGMGSRGFLVLIPMCLFLLYLPETGMASVQNIGRLNLGFRGSQMTWIDNDGMILVSNNSNFAFGFNPTQNVTLFLLVVMHLSSQTVIWSANRASLIQNSDSFVFDDSGNAYLQSQGSIIWSSNTSNKGVAAMELWDSGNLVLVGNDSNVVWQSFSHPVDTLISNQEFEGMKLVSSPGSNNLTYSLEIKSGDMILSASFNPPQPYWAMGKDSRRTINKLGGGVTSAILDVNSWKFYDQNKVLIWQFIFSDNTDANATWIAVLGNNGLISFSLLQNNDQPNTSPTRIPDGECNTPAACDPYYVCYTGNTCQCPSSLPSSCELGTGSLCNNSEAVELVDAGDGLSYFAIGFVPPTSKTNLNDCKNLCLGNCTCAALFFDSSSGNCFLFDQIGSLRDDVNGVGFSSYIKVLSSSQNGRNGGSSKKQVSIIIAIVILTILIVTGLIFVGIRLHKRNKKLLESPRDSSEEDNFLEGLPGMPIRFSYRDLQSATNDFSVKLGHGGFGSVYQGVLPDGTRVAVKKLEGIGQGKKEFRAEVNIIGRIHHLHLVRLKGFCAEGAHKLLVYEYMANGSLDRWLFHNNEGFMLDWDTRYNIALGTAKGLAYLHEDCDAKIVHCDIKPENVLLDGHFLAKVSDFGLAKLMTREQSHVFTTLRGTRGYLAPEWITNYAISEKSDVYSYGMVLLEIIGGRKNYDSSQSSEKSHFPSYAFKMNEEGKLKDIIDMKLKIDEGDERAVTAIRVALWCIQDDMHLRPPMTKVVQMLEGLCPVPTLPSSSPLGSRLYSCFLKSASEEFTSPGGSAPSDCNSDAYLSAIRLSGPR